MATIEKLLTDEVGSNFLSLVLVGPERGARPFLRSLAAAAGERRLAIATSRDREGWPQITVVPATAELTFEMIVRSALRQDPDYVTIEGTLAELPWDMLVNTALTGHGLLVRVSDATDAAPVLERLRSLPGSLGAVAAAGLPRVIVVGPTGIERVVSAVDDAAVWSRGEPLPTLEALTGRTPPPPPPPPAPLEPFKPELIARLRRALAPRQRTTFLPVLEAPSGDARRSKLSGLPVLAEGEAWPVCGECGSAMPLALQLAKSEVPEEARARFPEGASWLQLFYCAGTTCGAVNPADPASKNKLLRFLAEGATPAAAIPDFDWELEPKDIVGWTPARESPHREDNPELGEELSGAQSDLEYRLSCRGRANAPEPALPEPPGALEPLASARHGDKLLGWPAWTQGPEWEACDRCDEPLAFLFQIDASDGALDMLFAESGTGHISQCLAHKDVLAFRWSCT